MFVTYPGANHLAADLVESRLPLPIVAAGQNDVCTGFCQGQDRLVAETASGSRVFSALAADRPDVLVVLTEQRSMVHAKLLAELSRRERLPVLHSFSEGVRAGGLMSYGPNQPEMVLIATNFVAKILKGGKPAELPVEQPTRFELVINLKTAKEIGLAIPPSLLARADEVIE
jgi:putative tryptophan/tyrosine transport system substrate-binding protein